MIIRLLLQTQSQDSNYIPLENLCSFCNFCGKEFDIFALGSHECYAIEAEDPSDNKTIEEENELAVKDLEKNNADITNSLSKEDNEDESVKSEFEHITNHQPEKYGEAESRKNEIGDTANIVPKNDTYIQSGKSDINNFENSNDRGNNYESVKTTVTEGANVISVVSIPRPQDSDFSKKFKESGESDSTKPSNKISPGICDVFPEVKQDQPKENASHNFPPTDYSNEIRRSNKSAVTSESGSSGTALSKKEAPTQKSYDSNGTTNITTKDNTDANNAGSENTHSKPQESTSNAESVGCVPTKIVVQDVSSESKPEYLGTSSADGATKNIESITTSIKMGEANSTLRPIEHEQPVCIDLTEEVSAPVTIPLDKSKITVDIKRERIQLTEKIVDSNISIDLTEDDLTPVVLDEDNSVKVNERSQNVNESANIVPDSQLTKPIDKLDKDGGNANHTASNAGDNSSSPFYCEFCGSISSCLFELSVHKDLIHQYHYFDCFICGALFRNTSELLFHNKLKHDESSVKQSELDLYKYYCNQCGQGFNSVYMLLDHKEQLIESKKHVIEERLNTASTALDTLEMVESVGSSNGDRDNRPSCLDAEQTKSKPSVDSSHILSTGNERSNNVSGNASKSQEVLVEPESSRSQEMCSRSQAGSTERVLCEICNTLLDRTGFEEHQVSCRKERYVCTMCGLIFEVKTILVSHYRINHNMIVSCTTIIPLSKEALAQNQRKLGTNSAQSGEKISPIQVTGKSTMPTSTISVAEGTKSQQMLTNSIQKSSHGQIKENCDISANLDTGFKHHPEPKECVKNSENSLNRTPVPRKHSDNITQKAANDSETEKCKNGKQIRPSGNAQKTNEKSKIVEETKKKRKRSDIPEDTSDKGNSNSKKYYSKENVNNRSTSHPPPKKTRTEPASKESEKFSKPGYNENDKAQDASQDQNASKTTKKSSIEEKKYSKPPYDVLKEGKSNSLPKTTDEPSKNSSVKNSNAVKKLDETVLRKHNSDKYRKKSSNATSVPRTKSDEASGVAIRNVQLKESLDSGDRGKGKEAMDKLGQHKSECHVGAGNEKTKNSVVGGTKKSVTSFKKYLSRGEKSMLLKARTKAIQDEAVTYAQYKMMRSSKLSSDTNIGSSSDANGDGNIAASGPVGTPHNLPRSLQIPPSGKKSFSDAIQRGQGSQPPPLQRRRTSLHITQEDVDAVEFSDEPDTDEETLLEYETPEFCEVCGMKAVNFETLRDHRDEVHHGFKFKCFVCDMGFENIDTLIRHQSKYSKSVLLAAESKFLRQRKLLPNQLNPYNCGFCGLGFTLIELFIRHKQDKHTKRGGIKSKKGNEEVNECRSKEGNDQTTSAVDNPKTVDDNNTEISSGKTGLCKEKSNILQDGSLDVSNTHNPSSPEATIVAPNNKFSEFCEFCGEKYSSSEGKQKHFHLQNFECVICRTTFEDLNLLVLHYDLCHQKHEILNFETTEASIGKSFKYYCRFCGMGFYFINQLLAHKELQHYSFEMEIEDNTDSGAKEDTNLALTQIFSKPKVIPGLDNDSVVDQDSSNEGNTGSSPAARNETENNAVSGDLIIDVSSTESPQKTDRFMDLHEYLEQNNVQVVDGTLKESGGTDETEISSSTVASDKWIEAADQLTHLLSEDYFMVDLTKDAEDVQPATKDSTTNGLETKHDQDSSHQVVSQEKHSSSNRCDNNIVESGHVDIKDVRKDKNSQNGDKTGSSALNPAVQFKQGKSEKKGSMPCPNCPEKFEYWYQMNEHRVKGCSKRDSRNMAARSQSSQEPVSSNSGLQTLSTSPPKVDTTQGCPSKNNQTSECSVSTTTGVDADASSTGTGKLKTNDNNAFRKLGFFLRKCDCGEIFVTESKWNDHVRHCKKESVKQKTITSSVPPNKKDAGPSRPNKKSAGPSHPDKKNIDPSHAIKKNASPAHTDKKNRPSCPVKKIVCPICPDRKFATADDYKSHVHFSQKHQKFLQRLEKESSWNSVAPTNASTKRRARKRQPSSRQSSASETSENRVEPQQQAEKSHSISDETLNLLDQESGHQDSKSANEKKKED